MILGVLTLGQHPAVATIDVPPEHVVLEPVAPPDVDAKRLQRRISSAWQDPALGTEKSMVLAAYSGDPVVSQDPKVSLMPASTTKILTAAAALKVFGPQHRFTTSVVRKGNRIALVGGGDPQLSSLPQPNRPGADASLVRLARGTADWLRGQNVNAVRLDYDDSLFAAPAKPAFWGDDFLQLGIVAPITALMADGGRKNPPAAPRSENPARTATETFGRLLSRRGIEVRGKPSSVRAEGETIAEVQSAPLYTLVEHMLLVSDNTEADVLGHHIGGEVLNDATFAGGGRATSQVLSELGVDTGGLRLDDGSGLARSNRISARQLVETMQVSMGDEAQQLWPVYSGLPVAGFDGSLTYRFTAPSAAAARGAVTGKTGTLTGTSTLAGLISDRDGQLLLYAIMTNDINQYASSAAIDDIVARAAGCRCAQSAE